MSIGAADDHYISVFTPSQTSATTLEHIFVQRESMLQEAIARIDEGLNRNSRHHQLIVGPRGAGKTHFVTLLVHRLGLSVSEQRPSLRIAWMNEDETCTSFLDVLMSLYRALHKRQPLDFPLQQLEALYEAPDSAEADLAEMIARVLQQAHNCCLLIIENLDLLFESIGLEGQQKLRAYLQESRCFSVFATAQTLTRALSDRSEPFFGFFQTEYLQPLSETEAANLIGRIAQLHDQDNNGKEVSQFLSTHQGQARIAALHHLSGGNHRMYIVLSQFISRDSIDALVPPFLKMVDELTPYYQERIRWLPPLQRKIIEVLCAARHTVSVNDIARRVFRSNQSIAAQLKELKGKGYVRANKRGRESLYEVTEPLMRICVEVKDNQQSKPIALLVDFIRAWYDRQAIESRLKKNSAASDLSKRYLLAAMEANEAFGPIMISNDIDYAISENMSQKALNHLDSAAAIQKLTATIERDDSHARDTARALFNRGIVYRQQGDSEAAIADYSRVVTLENAPVDLVAKALVNRGVVYSQQGDSEAEITDYSRVVTLENAPVDLVAKALFNRGVVYRQQGDLEAAIADSSRVVTLENAPIDQVAKALVNRGFAYFQQGDLEAAIVDYSRVVTLENAPIDPITSALKNRGVINHHRGDYRRAIVDFKCLVQMEAASDEIITSAWMYLAESYILDSNWAETVKALYSGLAIANQEKVEIDYNIPDILTAMLDATAATAVRDRTAEVIALFIAGPPGAAGLASGLIEHLGILAQRDSIPSSEHLEQWQSAWAAAADQHPGLADALRIFKVGIAYLRGNRDETQLLDLIETDRKILAKTLGLPAPNSANNS